MQTPRVSPGVRGASRLSNFLWVLHSKTALSAAEERFSKGGESLSRSRTCAN